MKQWLNKIHQGDVLTILKKLPDECIDSVVTSPPYYGLRDYGVDGQLGLEPTLEAYLNRMLAITAELKRVLKPTGTMWWNHGDAYSGSGKGAGDSNPDPKYTEKARSQNLPKAQGLQKCLMLQNYRLAQMMVDEQSWILRNVIIWHKPNCMPSSVKDRFTVDYEPIFFFTKAKRYWFEQQFEPHTSGTHARGGHKFNLRVRDAEKRKSAQYKATAEEIRNYRDFRRSSQAAEIGGWDGLPPITNPQGRGKRSVWKISTKPYSEAHFATFPPALIETPIKAGCPEFVCTKCGQARKKRFETDYAKNRPSAGNDKRSRNEDKFSIGNGTSGFRGNNLLAIRSVIGYTDCGCNAGFEPGIVLDPFMGSGTTALVARQLGRNYLGIELNPEYIKLAEKRLREICATKHSNRIELALLLIASVCPSISAASL